MTTFWDSLSQAAALIATWDADLVEIVTLSLQVTLSSVFFACLIGLPIGAAAGALEFPGRRVLALGMNALMGLPPVVVGLLVYLALSASGPFGVLGLLYTPTAMVIAQTILVTPIVAALTRQVVADLNADYSEQFQSLGVPPLMRIQAILWDARVALMTVALAGFGRAVAEVGAVMIVGGNINHMTRVMTTAIALETSKGNLQLALALGLVLLGLAFAVNAAVMALRTSVKWEQAHA
ncbi:MAG: ABC transporter permease [Pseudomonadota bacterium]